MLRNNCSTNACRSLVAMGLMCLTPLAWATTGGGPMEGFVNEIFDIINGWGGRIAIGVAMLLGMAVAIKQNSIMPLGPAGLLSLVIAYGPEYLLDLSGALI